MSDAEFLGQGWRMPLTIAHGAVERVAGERAVEQSIWLILGTAKGERVMRPDFGCGIHDLVFSVSSATTCGRVAAEVREALTKYEPRIDLIDVTVEPDPARPSLLMISIDYRIAATNRVANMVFPFYLDRSGG